MRDLVETLKHCKHKDLAPTLKDFLVTQKKWCCEEKLKEDIVALASTVDVFNMKGSVEDPDWEGLTNLVPELKTAPAQKALSTTVDFLFKTAVKQRKIPDSLTQLHQWFTATKTRHRKGKPYQPVCFEAVSDTHIGKARIIEGNMFALTSLLNVEEKFNCLYADLPYNISLLEADQTEINKEKIKGLLNQFSVDIQLGGVMHCEMDNHLLNKPSCSLSSSGDASNKSPCSVGCYNDALGGCAVNDGYHCEVCRRLREAVPAGEIVAGAPEVRACARDRRPQVLPLTVVAEQRRSVQTHLRQQLAADDVLGADSQALLLLPVGVERQLDRDAARTMPVERQLDRDAAPLLAEHSAVRAGAQLRLVRQHVQQLQPRDRWYSAHVSKSSGVGFGLAGFRRDTSVNALLAQQCQAQVMSLNWFEQETLRRLQMLEARVSGLEAQAIALRAAVLDPAGTTS
eukprot:g79285.t1